jgi:hypothetical protein
LFGAWFYKYAAPTALEFTPSPSASPPFSQLPSRRDRHKVEAVKQDRLNSILDRPNTQPPII